MIGIGKIWKGLGSAKIQASTSTITRDILSRKFNLESQFVELGGIGSQETRAAPRFLPAKTATVITTKSGKRLAARIINVSRTGVAIEAELADLRANDVAKVGSHPVTPGRRVAHGMVLVFQTPLKVEDCGPQIVL